MIATAVHVLFVLVLGLALKSNPNPKPVVEELDAVKITAGYYKGCEAGILEETDTGVWVAIIDCNGQTGKRFFTHNFIRRVE